MKRWLFLLMLACMVAPISGCVVVPVPVARPYAQAHWVPGHFNAYGYWVRGHWA
jgi:hypothetical protein